MSNNGDYQGVYLSDEISATELGFEKLSYSFEVFFSDLYFILFDGVHFQYSKVYVIFLFCKRSNAFLICYCCSF